MQKYFYLLLEDKIDNKVEKSCDIPIFTGAKIFLSPFFVGNVAFIVSHHAKHVTTRQKYKRLLFSNSYDPV